MTRKSRWLRGAIGMAFWAVAECASVAALSGVFTAPAHAQFFEPRYPNLSRQRPSRGGFFQQLFGPSNSREDEMDERDDFGRNRGRGHIREREREPAAPADLSRAPSPRKPDKDAAAPTTSVVVMGDSMADWLAYGLEDAFADMPEVGIVRKAKPYSGLIRYEAKSELDWWHVARDILNGEKPNYVVMMLGIADRTSIREKDVAKETEKKKEEGGKDSSKDPAKDAVKDAANPSSTNTASNEDDEAGPIAATEPAKRSNGVLEFRSGPWEKVYSRRIDETIAALKSKGVPVFWVGLPSIRGTRSTADAVYLNDLYRARAEKAGAVYIDVWDGFVDEGGKYTNYGPDYEGQMRRLRSSDGVFFTKYGARKLAHYVEREIRRYMSNRSLQVSLPSGPAGPVPTDTTPAARPLAGPVVPLTMPTGNTDELLGGRGTAMARGDAIATGVLVKGDPVTAPSGRADSFNWPPGSTRPAAKPAIAKPAMPSTMTSATAPEPVTVKPEPAEVTAQPSAIVSPEPVAAAPAKPNSEAAKLKSEAAIPKSVAPARKPAVRREQKQQRAVDNRQRPPASVGQRAQQPPQRRSGGGLFERDGPFGWIR